jgi:predicted nucleotidyltransferase
LLGRVGSISHGTYVPPEDPDSIDDIDLLGIAVGDRSVYLGLHKFEQLRKQHKEYDSTVYEIRKFFRLLLKQNPNVLSLLWLRENEYLYMNDSGRKLLENRHLFISKQAYHSFAGYAHGQLHRMTHFGTDGKYHAAYMGKKRKELVEKFGWDVKNGGHLIRLLRMGIEYLVSGELNVYREDAYELKDIKMGKWSLEKVLAESDRLFKLAQEAYIRSTLPNSPDLVRAATLLEEILLQELGLQPIEPQQVERFA